jgi:hypothetical protein
LFVKSIHQSKKRVLQEAGNWGFAMRDSRKAITIFFVHLLSSNLKQKTGTFIAFDGVLG